MFWKIRVIKHSNCPLVIPGMDLFDQTPVFDSFAKADKFRNGLEQFEFLTYQLVPVGFRDLKMYRHFASSTD